MSKVPTPPHPTQKLKVFEVFKTLPIRYQYKALNEIPTPIPPNPPCLQEGTSFECKQIETCPTHGREPWPNERHETCWLRFGVLKLAQKDAVFAEEALTIIKSMFKTEKKI